MTDPAANVTTYAYNARNGLSSLAFSGLTATYAYDQVGNRTQVAYPNGAYTAYAYNSRGWVTSVVSRKSNNDLICSYSYSSYDNVGNPLHMVEEDNSYTDWAYDNIYRLTSDVKTGGSAYSRTFQYDAVGNRTQMIKDGQTTNYTYDANNKMTVAGGDSYTYDANGNTIGRTGSSGNATWGYDYENRMVSSTTPQGSAAFVYNGNGLRMRKVEAGVTRNFLFDAVRIYSEHDANMNELNRFIIERDWYYDPLIALRTGGEWRYPLYDNLGSTRRLINANQTATDSYSYEAFGGITAQSGSTYNPYRYVGSLGYYSADSTTGLQHLGARYYNAVHGRFTQPEPLGGNADGYPYVDNMPTAAADPSGLQQTACFMCFGGHTDDGQCIGGQMQVPNAACGDNAPDVGSFADTGQGEFDEAMSQKVHERQKAFTGCMVDCLGLPFGATVGAGAGIHGLASWEDYSADVLSAEKDKYCGVMRRLRKLQLGTKTRRGGFTGNNFTKGIDATVGQSRRLAGFMSRLGNVFTAVHVLEFSRCYAKCAPLVAW
jgi:RHS repeat-associated protein